MMTAGAWPEQPPPDSLLCEGRAMISALLEDLSSMEDVRVTTLWSRAWDPPDIAGVRFVRTEDRADELRKFRDAAATATTTFVIAPEIDGLLSERRRIVESVDGQCVGPSVKATDLTSDKLTLAAHFERHDVPTVPTMTATSTAVESLLAGGAPVVIKPRFGAGSMDVRRVATIADWNASETGSRFTADSQNRIVQPWTAGDPISVAAIVNPTRESIEVFPACDQILSDDDRFEYRGGRCPARSVASNPQRAEEMERLVRRACAAIGGLHGYVGFDLICPDDAEKGAVIVEVNPRLTTSYLGYRRLSHQNLTERLVFGEREIPPIRWRNQTIRYFPNGNSELQ